MKTIWLASIILIAVIVIAGAGIIITTTTPPAKKYKMALMVGGDETDLGFSYMAILGAEAIRDNYGWEVSISKLVPFWKQRTEAAYYGNLGYDLVYAVGGQFMVPMYGWDGQTAIPFLWNNTNWAQIPGANYSMASNLVALHPAFQTVGHYLAGVLAGKMTATGAVAQIYGDWYDYLSMEAYAFKAGVAYANPSAKVYIRNIGTWSDAGIGYTIAKTLIEEKNVDIIVQIADMAGRGIFAACQASGKKIIGTVADQAAIAPNVTLTSIMMDTPMFMEMVVQRIENGTWTEIGGTAVDMDLSYLAPYHQFENVVPQAVKDLLATTEDDIKAGDIEVPRTVTAEPPADPT